MVVKYLYTFYILPTFYIYNFDSCTVHLDIIKFLFLSNGCTIKYSKKMLKFTLKSTLKVLLHISV
jgi:hypothetical protein